MLALAELMPLRRAFWWALAFLLSTGFLAYVKSTWDVMPAAVGVAALAWVTVRALKGVDPPRQTAYRAAWAVGVAVLFRFTLLPFLLIAALVILGQTLTRLSVGERVRASLLLVALLLPNFLYNTVRTGLPWRPGESAPQFPPGPRLTLHYALSTPGIFFGFHSGLLFFAPICILGLGAATWKGRDNTLAKNGGLRWLTGVGAVIAYAAFVCAVHAWDVFGWGPRYLVPFIPAMFLIAVVSVERGYIPRPLGYSAVAVGLVTQAPLLVANWNALAAVVGRNRSEPNELVGIWDSAIRGVLHGTGIGAANDPRALQVPDTWWAHVLSDHGISYVVALAALAILLGGTAYLATRILRGSADATPGPEGSLGYAASP
jgi:hypothetical protein